MNSNQDIFYAPHGDPVSAVLAMKKIADTMSLNESYDLPIAEIEVEGRKSFRPIRVERSGLVPTGWIAKVGDSAPMALLGCKIDMGRTIGPNLIGEPIKLRAEIPRVRLEIDWINTDLMRQLLRRLADKRTVAIRRRASRFLHRFHLLSTRKAKRKAVRAIRKDAEARGISPTVAEAMEKVSGLRGKRK